MQASAADKPALATQSPTPAEDRAEDRAALLRSHAILYVDDELPNQLVFDATFGDDFNIICVSSGQEALAVLDEEEISILVTDNRMPGMSGIDLCAATVERHPHVLRVLCTAYSDQQTAIDAINRAGVHTYIVKPWDSAQVAALLERMVRDAHFDAGARALKASMLVDERRACVAAMREKIAQDMSNLVTVIHSACDGIEAAMPALVAAAEGDVVEEMGECLSDLKGARESLARIYRESRQATADAELDPTEMRLSDVVDTVARVVWTEIAGGATLDWHCADDLLVYADRISVVRILFNLIAHAARELADEPNAPSRVIYLHAAARERSICIDVGHSGRRDREVLKRRLATSTFGSRDDDTNDVLALALARDLVEANCGSLIVAEAAAPCSTVLRVMLPDADPV